MKFVVCTASLLTLFAVPAFAEGSPCETAARAVELARAANLPLHNFETLRDMKCATNDRATPPPARGADGRGRGRPATPPPTNNDGTSSRPCRRMVVLNQMAGISSGLSNSQKQIISQTRNQVCADNYRERELPRKWSNRRILKSANGAIFYPNGQMAIQRSTRLVRFANGRVAAHGNGKISYPSGKVAKDSRGRWFTPRGQVITGGLNEIQRRTCTRMSEIDCGHLRNLYLRVSGRDRDLVGMASAWRMR